MLLFRVRQTLNRELVVSFLREVGERARGPGTLYLTGGATAVLHGWRDSTVDIDIKLDPEPPGVFESIAQLKNELNINIELASPDLFIPVPENWAEHSDFIERYGKVDVFHFDYRGQALAKISRGHERDLLDVDAMLQRGLIDRTSIREAFALVRSRLVRFPGLDAKSLASRVEEFVHGE